MTHFEITASCEAFSQSACLTLPPVKVKPRSFLYGTGNDLPIGDIINTRDMYLGWPSSRMFSARKVLDVQAEPLHEASWHSKAITFRLTQSQTMELHHRVETWFQGGISDVTNPG